MRVIEASFHVNNKLKLRRFHVGLSADGVPRSALNKPLYAEDFSFIPYLKTRRLRVTRSHIAILH